LAQGNNATERRWKSTNAQSESLNGCYQPKHHVFVDEAEAHCGAPRVAHSPVKSSKNRATP